MKSYILLIISTLVMLSSCSNEQTTSIVKSPTLLTSDSGIFAGTVAWSGDWVRKVNQENSRVEIVGTNRFTTTNERGDWVLRNIDSGTYTLRFTRPGCDSFEIRNIHTNGNDSVYATWMWNFQNGEIREQKRVDLLEQPMTVRLSSTQGAITSAIYNVKDTHDTTRIIRRDTTYSFAAQFNVLTSAYRSSLAEESPYDIAYIVNDIPTIKSADLPNDSILFRTSDKGGWTRIDARDMFMKATKGAHTITELGQSGVKAYLSSKNINLSIGARLYLHAFPTWRGNVRQITYSQNEGTIINGGGGTDRFRGQVVTIPILWK